MSLFFNPVFESPGNPFWAPNTKKDYVFKLENVSFTPDTTGVAFQSDIYNLGISFTVPETGIYFIKSVCVQKGDSSFVSRFGDQIKLIACLNPTNYDISGAVQGAAILTCSNNTGLQTIVNMTTEKFTAGVTYYLYCDVMNNSGLMNTSDGILTFSYYLLPA